MVVVVVVVAVHQPLPAVAVVVQLVVVPEHHEECRFEKQRTRLVPLQATTKHLRRRQTPLLHATRADVLGKLLDVLQAGVVCGASIIEEGHKDAQLGGGHVHTLPVVHPAGVGAPLYL